MIAEIVLSALIVAAATFGVLGATAWTTHSTEDVGRGIGAGFCALVIIGTAAALAPWPIWNL